MRITNQMMINNTMANIQINKNQLSTIDNQLSTQKKISKPSEDPIVAIRALRLRSSLNQVTQYLDKNIPDANSWLNMTSSSLDECVSIITDLTKYCTQGSTDSYSSAERDTIASSLDKLKDAFYAQGDADYAGRYLFSGFDTDKPLTYQSDEDAANVDYTITQKFNRDDISSKTVYTNAYSNDDILNMHINYDGENAITPNVSSVYRLRLGYNGVEASGYTMVYDNIRIQVSEDGQTATAHKLDANGVPLPGAENVQNLTADSNGKFTFKDSENHDVVLSNTTDVNYAPEANEIAFNATTGEVLLGNDVYKKVYSSNSFSMSYNKSNFIKGDLNPTRYFDCVDNNTGITYDKKDSSIEYTINFAQNIKVNTEASEAFNYNLGRDVDDLVASVQSVLDVQAQIEKVKSMQGLDQYSDSASQAKLSTILDGLNKQKDLADKQMTKAFESGIGKMQGYQQQISLAKADVNNRISRLDLTKSRLTEQKTNFTSLKSQNEDIDLEEVVVNYSAVKLVYDASLTAASKVVQQTLLDFL